MQSYSWIKTMQSYIWTYKRAPRRRGAWLLLVKDDAVRPFSGRSIPGWVVVTSKESTSEGVWSETTYRLALHDTVRGIPGHDGFETRTFAEGLQTACGGAIPATWDALAEKLGVSVISAQEFLRAWRPKEAAGIDRVEEAIAALDDEHGDDGAAPRMEVVSFGNPTNRQRMAGFWEASKEVPGVPGAELRLLQPQRGWELGNVEIVGVPGSVLAEGSPPETRGASEDLDIPATGEETR